MELQRALDVALNAARQAGALIREESWHAGGPRGSHGHAPVDRCVETLIRQRLQEAFPQWSYVGEETGSQRQERADIFWLVDPNDGTDAFLRGFRGNSVSIALIIGGEPVLGVVYAPSFPDDRGDELAWAAGCGPVRRNGRPLAPRTWPSSLGPDRVVLVSQDADTAFAANVACCAPARYRPIPGIAWRLALVAAGEADAGLSLNAPGWLDVAGGHALLRGAGGDLLGADGLPVQYPFFGNFGVGARCCGGAPAVARELLMRDWSSVMAPPPRALSETVTIDPPLPFPIRLERERRQWPDGLLARAQGALLGLLAGAALGSCVALELPRAAAAALAACMEPGCEPCQGWQIPDGETGKPTVRLTDGGTWNTLAGQPVAGAEGALALARLLLRDGGYDVAAGEKVFSAWQRSLPPGREVGRDAHLARVVPIALATWMHPEAGAAWTAGELTRTDCAEAGQTLVRSLAAALRGAARHEIHQAAVQGTTGALREALKDAAEGHGVAPGDPVRETLARAFSCLLHGDSLEESLTTLAREGGNAAGRLPVAGALLGAYYGRDGVPAPWRRAVLTCRPHPRCAGARHPRPSWCWPVDALEMAERLLGLDATLPGDGANRPAAS